MRILVSGVVAELGTAMARVTDELRALGNDVVALPASADLLDLAARIDHSDLVIALLGERCGPFPDLHQVHAIGEVAYQHNFCTDNGASEASFAQWSLLLACQHDIPVVAVDLTQAACGDHANPERGDRQTDQRAFRHWVAQLAIERIDVSEPAQLVPQVLAAVRQIGDGRAEGAAVVPLDHGSLPAACAQITASAGDRSG